MMGGGPGYRECRTGTDGSADWKKKECRPGGVRGEVLGGALGGRWTISFGTSPWYQVCTYSPASTPPSEESCGRGVVALEVIVPSGDEFPISWGRRRDPGMDGDMELSRI